MSPRKADPPTLEYVLLGLIRAHPSHGYELFHSLRRDEGIGMVWRVKPAQLYGLLDKLEQMGWLESRLEAGEGFLQRKTYRISPTGEQVFQEWMERPVAEPHRMRQEFLARLYFAMREVGPQDTVPHIVGAQDSGQNSPALVTHQAEICLKWQESLQAQLERLPAESRFEHEVLRFRLGQIQAMRVWLENLQTSWVEKEQK